MMFLEPVHAVVSAVQHYTAKAFPAVLAVDPSSTTVTFSVTLPFSKTLLHYSLR